MIETICIFHFLDANVINYLALLNNEHSCQGLNALQKRSLTNLMSFHFNSQNFIAMSKLRLQFHQI